MTQTRDPASRNSADRPPATRDTASRARRALWTAILFSLVINLLMLTAPLYMLQVFDRVIVSRSLETLLYLSLFAGVALLVMWVLDLCRSAVMASVAVWMERRLGGDALGGAVARASSERAGSARTLRDLATVRGFLTGPHLFAFFDAPWMPLFLGLVFLLHPTLGWIALAGALVLFALAIANELLARRPAARAAAADIEATRMAETAVRNADSLTAMGMTDGAVARWTDANDRALSAHKTAAGRSSAIAGTAKSLRLALQIAVMGAGAYLVLADNLTGGAMIAASILVARALSPVEQAIGGWRTAMAARAAWKRVGEAVSTGGRKRPMSLPKPAGALSVEGLRYAPPGSTRTTLNGVSFQLAPGESLGLIGPTAAGKSTLARLLVGSIGAQVGQVRLDGADVAAWEARDRGPHVGYLAQDVELVDGTVAENISRLGPVDAEAVVAAARAAEVHELILGLPDGYETRIGAGGVILSGGQRQRIGLARALYGDPALVVLDEPNASLDQAGEAALVRAIDRLRTRGATLVVVSHRPSLLRNLDKVLILQEGRVERFGPREEVMSLVAPQRRRPVAVAGA